jgi:hypothetical protein
MTTTGGRARALVAWLVVGIAAFVSSGCTLWLSGPGSGDGPATRLINMSTSEYVVRVSEADRTRYYAVPPGTDVAIDGVGEANPGPETITLMDPACASVRDLPWRQLGWDLWAMGGVIRIRGDNDATFEPGLRGSFDERVGAFDTCESAAAAL